MLLFPIPDFRKRSALSGKRKRTPPAPLVALMMIAANDPSGGPDDLAFTAVFNTSAAAPLASVDASEALKWTARFDGSLFEGNTLTLLSATSLLVEMAVVGAEAGPNVVNYSNAPSDIADVLGRKLAAFTGFPL